MPELAAAGVHEATPVGPLVRVLHVTVADEVQVPTPTGVVQPQVVAVQAGVVVAVANTAVQPEGAAVGPVATTGQVVTV